MAATDIPTAPLMARIKHRLATSPAGRPLARLRALRNLPRRLKHPELAELYREDDYIDALLPRFVKPGANCLDIGGHYGAVSYTLQGLSAGGWLGIIEASPWKAALLRARFPDATVFETAVSDSGGSTTFYENVARPGFSSLTDRSSRGETRALTVDMARVDDLLPADRHIDFIKIDVEGYEYPALRGAENLLTRARPVILFEAGAVSDDDLDTSGYAALFTWLTRGLGYAIFAARDLAHDAPPLDADTFETYRQYPFQAFNYFAIPADRGGRP